MVLNSREGQQTQIKCEDSGLTLTEVAQRCGRCLTPAIIQGQLRQGCEQPDLLEDGPAHYGAPGPDVLETPLPTQTSLQFCLLSIRKAPRLQITGWGPDKKTPPLCCCLPCTHLQQLPGRAALLLAQLQAVLRKSCSKAHSLGLQLQGLFCLIRA